MLPVENFEVVEEGGATRWKTVWIHDTMRKIGHSHKEGGIKLAEI